MDNKSIIARALGVVGNITILAYHKMPSGRDIVFIRDREGHNYYLDECLIEIMEVAE